MKLRQHFFLFLFWDFFSPPLGNFKFAFNFIKYSVCLILSKKINSKHLERSKKITQIFFNSTSNFVLVFLQMTPFQLTWKAWKTKKWVLVAAETMNIWVPIEIKIKHSSFKKDSVGRCNNGILFHKFQSEN